MHLKESDFRARRENSFLTLITSLHCEDPMFCSKKLISQQGPFSKNSGAPSYRPWSAGPVKIDSELIASIICQIFYLDISLMLTEALMAIWRVQSIMARFSVAAYVWDVSRALRRFPLPLRSMTERALVSRLYLEEFRREQAP